MNDTLKQFNKFLEQSKNLADQYGFKTEYENLKKTLECGTKKEMVLMVCGEFKRGKSSFVNALLGQDLCPVADGITTSTVSIIHYGEKAKAVRHYSTLGVNDSNEEKLVLKEEEIPVGNIEKFAKGTTDEIGNTMYIDIEVSNLLLKNGLVIIDTPGVGSLDPRHLFLTLQAVPKADAFFFVTDTGEPLTTTELDFLKQKLVSTGKPFDVLLNKSDQIDRDSLNKYIQDTEKKIFDDCGLKVNCIPVSSTEWMEFNKTGNERRRMSSNCEAIHTAISGFKVRREQYFVEKFREEFCIFIDGIKKEISKSLESVKNASNTDLAELQQRLNEMKALRDMVTNENSEFRTKIDSIIETSQDKVMQEFSKESVLLSSNTLEEILDRPESAKKEGGNYVLDNLNKEIQKLGKNLDTKIDVAIKNVIKELSEYIKDFPINNNGYNGMIQCDISDIKHSFAESFVINMRQALPFLGVSALVGSLIWWPIGIAAGVYYVVQSIIGSKKAERIAYIRKQITPRIKIAVDELRSHIQKRYTNLHKEVVKSLQSIAGNITRQMQKTMTMIQECQQNDQKKVLKIKEIQGELNLIENVLTQVKVYGTNNFAKK